MAIRPVKDDLSMGRLLLGADGWRCRSSLPVSKLSLISQGHANGGAELRVRKHDLRTLGERARGPRTRSCLPGDLVTVTKLARCLPPSERHRVFGPFCGDAGGRTIVTAVVLLLGHLTCGTLLGWLADDAVERADSRSAARRLAA
jgi:hypothetical protein